MKKLKTIYSLILIILFTLILNPVYYSFSKAQAPETRYSGFVTADDRYFQESISFDTLYSLESRAAMAAHHLCSGLWVVGRDYRRTPEEVLFQDITRFRVFGWEDNFTYKIDRENRIVTVSALGVPPRTAKFTVDQGSVILPRGVKELYFTPVSVRRNLPDAATQSWPMGDLNAASPIPNGVDFNAINGAFDWMIARKYNNTRALVVVYRGKIIGERYAPGWTKDTPQISWSQGKSITAALIGVLA